VLLNTEAFENLAVHFFSEKLIYSLKLRDEGNRVRTVGEKIPT
jgi:hypothetical protein